jgi:hypothetical protein
MPGAPAAASQGRLFFLKVPCALRHAAQAGGARWDARRRAWAWRGERLLEGRANRVRRVPSKPTREVSPRPHQAEAIALLRPIRRDGRPGALIGDAVGLGKTWTAWLALHDDSEIRAVLIACPLAVAFHWRTTIQAADDGGKEIAVVSYERLQRLFALPNNGKTQTLRGKVHDDEAMTFDAIGWDEAHRLHNPDSARAKFARKIDAKTSWRLWPLATAGENPLHLAYLAPLLAQATRTPLPKMKDSTVWLASQGLGITKEAFGRWTWTGDEGAQARARTLLDEDPLPLGIRRRPEDIAAWPEMERIPFPIEIAPEALALSFAPGTIDEHILEVVLAKVWTMRSMQGNETATTRAIEEALLRTSP